MSDRPPKRSACCTSDSTTPSAASSSSTSSNITHRAASSRGISDNATRSAAASSSTSGSTNRSAAPRQHPRPAAIAQPANAVINGFQILDAPVRCKASLARDPVTGLVRQRCSVGQSWNGSACAGEAEMFTFEQAQQLARNCWCVPTLRELASLTYCSTEQASVALDFKDGRAC